MNYLIDFNLEIEKLSPINVKEIELNRQKIDDNIKKSIILYNVAIGEIKKGDFHQAISDLKKAMSYNKDFTEAIKIMGLCYANMNEFKKAEKIFKSLNKYGIYNVLVNEYLQSLSIKKSMNTDLKNSKIVNNVYSYNRKQVYKVNGYNKKLVISLAIVLVIILGASVKYFYSGISQTILAKFMVSSKVDENNSKIEKNAENIEGEKDKNSNTKETEGEITTVANSEAEGAKKDLANDNSKSIKLEDDNSKKEVTNMLGDVEKAFNSGSYEKAASILINMKNSKLDEESKVKYNQLWQGLKPNPAWTIYNDGNKLYKENKYSDALPKLLIASEIQPSLDLMPWITFQIGMCYKETKDNTNALIYFNKVKDEYPKSQYVPNAKRMISEIS